jgi:hypothetical protein
LIVNALGYRQYAVGFCLLKLIAYSLKLTANLTALQKKTWIAPNLFP